LNSHLKANIPKVSLIILNYNGEETIEECIKSALSQNYPNYEIIVVDNNSKDGSISILKKYASKIRLFRNIKNVGYTGGMNYGAEKTSEESEYLAFITQDAILSPNWIEQTVYSLIENEEAAAVSSKIFDVPKKALISELKILYPSGYYYIPLNKESSQTMEVDFPSGEAFLIRKTLFFKCGKFDEDYFAYYEDGDLGWRIRLKSFKIIYNPKAEVRHYRSSTFKKEGYLLRVYLYERNRVTSCLKNLNPRSLIAFLLSEIVMLLFHMIRTLKNGKDEFSEAYIYAIFHSILQLKKIFKKRLKVIKKVPDKILFRSSLPSIFMKRSGLILAFSPKYRRKEIYYLRIMSLITRIFPPR
jgi:GT2 family glycosyltransferase